MKFWVSLLVTKTGHPLSSAKASLSTIDTHINDVKGIDDKGVSPERDMWDTTRDNGIRS